LRIGSVDLPVRWRSDEATYQADMAELDQVASYAAKAKVYACKTVVFPESDHLPYHENFEQHRKRLAEIAAALGKHGIRLAVGFHAAPARREGKQFQFIQEADALALLLKSVVGDNVGLWLDTWNWYVGGGTVASLKAFGIDKVAYVTIADAPNGVDRAALTEEQRTLPIEEGAAKVDEIATLLKDQGYKGPITLAPHAECFNGMKNDDILKQCKVVLDELVTVPEGDKKLVAAGAGK
ncbi:MAG TPA: TIM barrel protein, partial [Pirellulaceae bacterium]|nr:TIM barrel protein [Pirellulaceae bacterium]